MKYYLCGRTNDLGADERKQRFRDAKGAIWDAQLAACGSADAMVFSAPDCISGTLAHDTWMLARLNMLTQLDRFSAPYYDALVVIDDERDADMDTEIAVAEACGIPTMNLDEACASWARPGKRPTTSSWAPSSTARALARCVLSWDGSDAPFNKVFGKRNDVAMRSECENWCKAHEVEAKHYRLCGERLAKKIGGGPESIAAFAFYVNDVLDDCAERSNGGLSEMLLGNTGLAKETRAAIMAACDGGRSKSPQARAETLGLILLANDCWVSGEPFPQYASGSAFLAKNAERFRKPASLL